MHQFITFSFCNDFNMNTKERRYYKKKINILTRLFKKTEIKDSNHNLNINFQKLSLNDFKPSENIYKIRNISSK